jgi:signal transduction histidine kinase
MARVAIACGVAGLLPLAGVMAFVVMAPGARVSSLALPLVVMTIVATALAILSGLAFGHPQQRSLIQLHRLTRRALGGDQLASVALDTFTQELRPIAADLAELARELERLRTACERAEIDLRVSVEGRESLVSHLAIVNKRLRDETELVHEFVETVNRPVAREQMCLRLLEVIEDEVPYQEAFVYLVDTETAQLRLAAVENRERNQRHGGRYVQELSSFASELVSGRSLPVVVLQTAAAIRVEDSQVDRRFVGLRESLRSHLAVPIEVKSRVIGVLHIGTAEPRQYDQHDEQRVATLARFAALWIDNVRLLQEAAQVEALRKVDKLKSELLSTVSHELRTPLALIKGYATSLLRPNVKWDDETTREFLQIIDEESDRLSGLIEDLLQMSEIEAGVLRVNKQPVRISRIAQRVVKKAKAQAGDHPLTVSIGHDVPETMGDPRRLEQVLHNLIVNAVKYSPEPTPIVVRVETHQDDVVVSVRDQGIGIAPEHVEHVFDRFYRVEGTLVRQTRGSGLGLPICRGLVEAHGGKIWVESEEGKGSTFYVAIPIVPVDRSSDPDGAGPRDTTMDE